MPLGERLYRLVWLGPVGRAFITFSSRGVVGRAGGRSSAAIAIAPASAAPRSGNGTAVPPPGAAIPQDRIDTLEARIAALERWRDGVAP
jgi:hypothetical protein